MTRAASVRFVNVSKLYGAVRAVDDVSFDVAAGTLVTLLGPSGCGKTTTLRLVAGLERASLGKIYIGDEDVTHLGAAERDVSMVFQSYALFPHLNVLDNVMYGPLASGASKNEARDMAREKLGLLGLAGFEARLPSELSGGQQQRVAVARAIVLEPRVLLFDEPLSNLDARLRRKVRDEIRELQQRLGLTVVYVTHDQQEALAVSDRICVLQAGRIEQVATPFELYRRPETRFAAGFVGAMNFLPARIAGGALEVGGTRMPVPGAADAPVEIAIRPEDVVLGDGPIGLGGVVRAISFLGREATVRIETPLGVIEHLAANPSAELLGSEGRSIGVHLPADRIAVFAANGARVAVALA